MAGRRSAAIGENGLVPELHSWGTASPRGPARVSHSEEPTSASSVLPEAGRAPFRILLAGIRVRAQRGTVAFLVARGPQWNFLFQNSASTWQS